MERTKKAPDGMVWETPDDHKPDWGVTADALRSHPNEWLRVFTHGRQSWANALTRGRIAALNPDLGFEFTTTDNTRDYPRRCTLYARYVPEKEK